MLGRKDRLLDEGEIDSGFRDRSAALQAVSAFLSQFPVWDRTADGGGWWAQRSPDADLKVLITLDEDMPLEADIIPAMWAASSKRAVVQA